jgi:RNA polymerase sigma-70 factor, ECF subfamily
VHAGLRERFLAALEPSAASAFVAHEPLDSLLSTRLGEARSALDFEVDDELWIAAVASALEHPDELATLATTELYLAAACGRGEHEALRRFEHDHGPELDRAVARSPSLGLSTAEFRQLVLVHLFVREGQRAPRILGYRGRGSLRGWVRVTAARLIIDLARRPAAPRGDHEAAALLERLDYGHDPELDHLRRAYNAQLREAFIAAIAALNVRQRNLLRQRHIHDVPVDALARLYAVHRSTVYLWLEQARASLLAHARTLIAANTRGDRLESLIRVLGSELDVSLRRLLDSTLEDEA